PTGGRGPGWRPATNGRRGPAAGAAWGARDGSRARTARRVHRRARARNGRAWGAASYRAASTSTASTERQDGTSPVGRGGGRRVTGRSRHSRLELFHLPGELGSQGPRPRRGQRSTRAGEITAQEPRLGCE